MLVGMAALALGLSSLVDHHSAPGSRLMAVRAWDSTMFANQRKGSSRVIKCHGLPINRCVTLQTSDCTHYCSKLTIVLIFVARLAFQRSKMEYRSITPRRIMASATGNSNMGPIQGKSGIIVSYQRELGRLEAIFGMTFRAIIPVFYAEVSLMMVGMTIGASIMRHLQNHATLNFRVSLMTLLTFYISMFPAQSETGEVMIK
jgi:hypothetical protein